MKGAQVLLEAAGFEGAAAGEIAGIEIQHQPAALEGGQVQAAVDRFALLIGGHTGEIKVGGGFVQRGQHTPERQSGRSPA